MNGIEMVVVGFGVAAIFATVDFAHVGFSKTPPPSITETSNAADGLSIVNSARPFFRGARFSPESQVESYSLISLVDSILRNLGVRRFLRRRLDLPPAHAGLVIKALLARWRV